MTGYIFLFIYNAIFLSFVYMYWRKKRLGPAWVILIILAIVNVVVLFVPVIRDPANSDLLRDVRGRLRPDEPVILEFPFINNHVIYKDNKWGTIYAMDSEDYRVTLMRENPRQLYQESFHIMMGKENMQFETQEEAYNYATFLIHIYYSESEPVYLESVPDFLDVLKRKNNTAFKYITDRRSTGMTEAGIIEPPIPGDYDWDVDGERLSFSDPTVEKVIRRINKPDYIRCYDDALNFRIYTYSLKYHELVEWQFKVFKDGEIYVKRLNEIVNEIVN
jgi:hypothetical protein